MSNTNDRTTRTKPRLQGIDLARAIALIGMAATHTLELATADGTPLPASILAGKAAALFAVLAGFSITLSTRSYDSTRNAALSLVIRGALIAGIGIILGSITTNIAVILVNYGVMFILAAAIFRAPTKVLAVVTPLWLVIAPVVGFAIRSAAEFPKAWSMPHLGNFTDLPYMGMAIFSTGYFPVLEWFGYILVGLLLSRLNWQRTATAVRVWIAGLVTAAIAYLTSTILLKTTIGMTALEASSAGTHPKEWGGLLNALYVANAGSTPTDTWWWLAIVGPHSSTPFDLIYTSAISAAVIAALMLATSRLKQTPLLLQPWLTLGTMSLTAYSIHVIFREFTSSFLLHVLVMVLATNLYAALISKTGPLEKGVSKIVARTAPKTAVQDPETPGTVSEDAQRQEVQP